MNLNDKIYSLRKSLGLSQEDLASALNVSRQSISNWETGAANPEIGKLTHLAETLGLSVDFLLDDSATWEAPNTTNEIESDSGSNSKNHHKDKTITSADEAQGQANIPPSTISKEYPDWLDSFPGFLKSSVLRYGWLYGIRLALSGLSFIAFGLIGKTMVNAFLTETNMGFGNDGITITPNNLSPDVTTSIENSINAKPAGSSFMSIIPNAAIILGILAVIGGLALAYALRRWGKRKLEEKKK